MDKMQGADDKRKRKELIMNRLQESNMNDQSQPSFKMETKGPFRIDTEEDFRAMPYEGKAKYDNEMKALASLKNQNPEVNQKPKKFFYEHYATDAPYEPVIGNNNNPSGRPPNIPPEMYEGIVVKPKRPWVHLGTQNLPPVCYQEINETSFRTVAKKNMDKPEEKKKAEQKPRKKNPNKDSANGQDDQFNMSDEMDLDGESIFNSRFDGDSKYSKSRVSKRGNSMREGYDDDDDYQSENTETKKRGMSLFQDGDSDDEGISQMDDEAKSQSRSRQFSKKDLKNKKKVLEDSD